MRSAPIVRSIVIGVATALLACACAPAAMGAGTGDDSADTQDRLSPREAAVKDRLERESDRLAARAKAERGNDALALISDAPYRYLWTPSHKQERSYWCGPATCQVIDNYFGSWMSQSAYSNYLRTTLNGTDFSLVDDCLRAFAAKPYYYYGGLTDSTFGARVADSILNHGMPVAADLNIIASIWPNYVRDHSGHIVPIEAFDWRYNTLRLNDVYEERDSGGGATFGHTVYDRAVVWNGVYNHFRRAVVAAP